MVSISVHARRNEEPVATLDAFEAALESGRSGFQAADYASQMSISLRRTGMRPLKVRGREIASSTSHQPGPSFWYELNIIGIDGGGVVLDIRLFHKREGASDVFKAIEAGSLEEAMDFLESYDPAHDFVPMLDLDDPNKAPIELAIEAASMRLTVIEARRQFRMLSGEVLYALHPA
jgi:hypothetical protein